MAIDKDQMMLALRERFPEFKDELDEDCFKGLPHTEAGVVSQRVQDAICEGERDLVVRGFEFADWAFCNGDDFVKNVVLVSFLEHIYFADTKKHQRSWAWPLLSKLMQAEYKSLMAHLDEIHGTNERHDQVPSEWK